MALQIAYLSQGRLFLKRPDREATEVSSEFTRRANESAQKTAERNSWKSSNEPGQAMLSSQILWRNRGRTDPLVAQITGVTPVSQKGILFALHTQSVGGLFTLDVEDGLERRLYHKNGFRGRHLARHPTKDLVALSIDGEQRESHLAITDSEGRRMKQVTEGDAMDECPSWIAGEEESLVFQSAGIARNAQGLQTGIGPYRIEKLDMAGGKMSTLVEHDRFDHLSPRVGADGSLYFIRRPWTPHRNSFLATMSDALLFPFRLAWAIVHFFNFFSMAFSGKPLLTSGGPPQEQNATTMMLWGKLIDAEKAMKNSRPGKSPVLIPSNWKLIRQSPDGREEVLASSVASFDLVLGGGLIYTNGSTVFWLDPGGRQEAVCSANLIESVICLSGDQRTN